MDPGNTSRHRPLLLRSHQPHGQPQRPQPRGAGSRPRRQEQVPVLIIDEAHLLRLDVFAQFHTFAQVDFDSRTLLPIVLSGQTALTDKLLFHTSRPFSSCVVGRSHLESLQRDHMAAYVAPSLRHCRGKAGLFSDDAMTALHQSSGGMLRRAGILARGAMLAAVGEKCPVIIAEHIRVATTETL